MDIGNYNYNYPSSSSSTLLPTAAATTEDFIVPNSYTFYGETIVIFLFLIIGATLNGPLLYVYCISNQARSIADKFLINLILADILSLVILLPTIIVDLFLLERNEETYFRNMTTGMASEIQHTSQRLMDDGNNHTRLRNAEGNYIFDGILSSNHTVHLLSDSSNSVDSHHMIGTTGDEPWALVELVETWDWSCTFKKCLLSGIATASILSALEIAMERYLAIVAPLHYHKFLTKYKVVMTSFGGGIIAVGSAVLSSLDPCEPVFPSCTRTTVTYTSTLWWPLYTLGHVTLFFIFPVLCMTCIYIKIWLEARRQKAKISLQYKTPFFLHVTTTSPSDEKLKNRTKFFLHPVILRFKIIDRFVHVRMDRAARVAICTCMVTIICWSPYYFVQCAHSIRSILEQLKGTVRVKESWSHLETTVPLLAASLHPVLAPFFYGYRYTAIRDRVLILLHLDQWLPTVRERRSNSLSRGNRSQPRLSCSALIGRKKSSETTSPSYQVINEKLQAQVDEIGSKHKDQDGREPSSISSGVPIDCESQAAEMVQPHPFLFTIGSLEEEDEEDENNGSYAYESGLRSADVRQIDDQQTLNYESSNCSSSEALLAHCCNTNNNNYTDDRIYSNDEGKNGESRVGCSNGSYESFCINASEVDTSTHHSLSSLNNIDASSSPPPYSSTVSKSLVVSPQHCWEAWSKLIQNMIQCYSDRWNSHRQSVSSTSSVSSVVTLLSSRSISSDHLPS